MSNVPDYPCVEMLAKGLRTNVKPGDNAVQDHDPYEASKFIKIRGAGIAEVIDHYRNDKGWPVVAVHNLDKMKKGERKVIQPDVNRWLNSPEARMVRESIRSEKVVTGKGSKDLS
jgi:hypothetical protein